MGKKKSCLCEECQDACRHKPGWFLPKQIPSLLKHFKAKEISNLLNGAGLAIDWWVGDSDKDNILVLSPNIIGNEEFYFPGNPKGECVFFKKGKCLIHKVKPFECANALHSDTEEIAQKRKRFIKDQWDKVSMLEEFREDIEFETYTIFDHLLGGIF